MGVRKQLRIYVSQRKPLNLNRFIAHLSHKIFKAHGLSGHLVRQAIRRSLKKYAYSLSRRHGVMETKVICARCGKNFGVIQDARKHGHRGIFNRHKIPIYFVKRKDGELGYFSSLLDTRQPALPIYTNEVRIGSSSKGIYWGRLLIVMGALGFIGLVIWLALINL